MVKNKKVLYDHSADKRNFKWKGSTTLKRISLSEMPDYLSENKKIIYDLDIDQKNYKWKGTKSLNKVPLSAMPDYLYNNYKKYSNWLEI